MSNLVFSGITHVDIQGVRVLRLIDRFDEFAEYSIIGFSNQVILRDFRATSLKSIDFVLSTQDTSSFPDSFNGVAHTFVFDFIDKELIVIELRDTLYTPQFILWIAIGFDGYIPIYEYEISLIQQNGDSDFALIAILDIDQNKIAIFDDSTSPELFSTTHSSSSFPLSCIPVG